MQIALTIAGSDSGGGAGIQADLKTFHRFGVFGTSVLTAITAQNTRGVQAWEGVSPALVRAQLASVATDLRPAAVKSGMLGDTATVEVVEDGLRAHRLAPYVLDPVMVATSGDPLLRPDAVDAIVRLLIPRATLITPNLDEAELLLGRTVRDESSMLEAARALVDQHGAEAALVKGGHLTGADAIDVLWADGRAHTFRHPRLATTSTHGTGCTLSAAIAAHLAQGLPLVDAVRESLGFVHRAIASAPGLGAGHGPLNHFA
ncbi:MAG: bifunctional hydroxymethylpyrimidine kinase/phosphomethylpyrimidine kinase [Gemmatimonadaceae bacterium]|nr:bifunctional hydroxymethylpyrimidine kinase/phosphomethylpyrimidine kinase [Gemmatimonadaceae bacterium]